MRTGQNRRMSTTGSTAPGRVAALAALLGGATWVVAAVLGWDGDAQRATYDAGLVLGVLALAAGGYTLVDHAPVWLRLLVTVATAALGYVVWVSVVDAFTEDHLPVLLAGAVMVVVGVATLALRRGRRDGGQVPHGHHAAR
jgi:hypothetical protein